MGGYPNLGKMWRGCNWKYPLLLWTQKVWGYVKFLGGGVVKCSLWNIMSKQLKTKGLDNPSVKCLHEFFQMFHAGCQAIALPKGMFSQAMALHFVHISLLFTYS